jgi:uncharacterized RDD family membrane protein YckC
MSASIQYAHFHQRALAWVLDVFVLSAVLSPLLYLFTAGVTPHLHAESTLMLFRLVRLLLVLALSLAVLSGFTARFGGTPGKVLLGLQVIDATTGRWLRPGQAGARILLSIPVIVTLLGILVLLFDAQRRAFHDRVMHTLVIVKEHDYADDALPGDLR